MAADEFPLPYEYRDMQFNGVVNEPPADVSERTIVFLDCGNIDRMPVDFLQQEGLHILNVDHHHDNTRFGTVNLVVPNASSTAEIVYSLAKELGVELTPPIADALYVAIVTDTGRFMYENTTAATHRIVADLIESGVVVDDVYRRLYENMPFARLELLARALGRVQRFDGGVTLTHLTREDYRETGAIETDSEGIVDHLRAAEGTAVAVLIRELLAADRAGRRKVSLRATDSRVDVSVIARSMGGGGHRQAAGFSTELPIDELVERVRSGVADQL
jgi:phosphoesterase RecJ-like protein